VSTPVRKPADPFAVLRTKKYVALLILAALSCVVLAPCAGPARATSAPGWHLAMSATFTGKTTGFTAGWPGGNGITHPPNSYETAAMDPARVSYTPSGLAITPEAKPWTGAGKTWPYRSGDVSGYEHQGWKAPLMVQARLFVPCTPAGLIQDWPSFWMVGNPYQWPRSGEIDIMEGLSGKAYTHVHYIDSAGKYQGPGKLAGNGRWCGWHTYTLTWHGSTIDIEYDSTYVAHYTGFNATAPEFPVVMYSMAQPGVYSQCPPKCSGPVTTAATLRASWLKVWTWS
jgi:beta-glucanase (GH16 family)